MVFHPRESALSLHWFHCTTDKYTFCACIFLPTCPHMYPWRKTYKCLTLVLWGWGAEAAEKGLSSSLLQMLAMIRTET